MQNSLIAIDVGNSRTKFAAFAMPVDPRKLPVGLSASAAATGEVPDWPAWYAHVMSNGVEEFPRIPTTTVIAGANPPMIDRLSQSWPQSWPKLQRLQIPDELPLVIRLPEPQRVGIDRLLNAVAVQTIRRSNQPMIVVDSGTATTVDAIDFDGAFIGGAILPGFDLSAQSLHDYTALLPRLQIAELTEPPAAVGNQTEAALWSGLYHGHRGAVIELVNQMRRQLGKLACTSDELLADENQSAIVQRAEIRCHEIPVVVTGGGGPWLLDAIPGARLFPNLSLQGLALATRAI